MTKYEKGTFGWLKEKAKEHGFGDNIKDYIRWAKQTGKIKSDTDIRKDHDNKLVQKKGYKDISEYNREKYHRDDPIIENRKLKYHPSSKEFQEEANRLGLTGNEYIHKLREEGKLPNLIEMDRKKNQKLIEKNGCKNWMEYLNKCKQKLGYKDFNEYQQELSWNKGSKSPMSENDNCASYMGVYIGENIAEPILTEIFGEIEKRMPYGNPGYEYIVKGGYKIDCKSGKIILNSSGSIYWAFGIYYNKIADYFLLLAFDDMDVLSLIHVWLIKKDEIIRGRKLNRFSDFKITNILGKLSEFQKYDWIDKLKCINDIQNRLKEI